MRRRVHGLQRFFWPVTALLGISLAVACGEEVTIPDPESPDAGVDPASREDGATADGQVGPDTDGGVDAADVVCPDVAPDDATGIYVAPPGTNTAACGTRTAPCKTIDFSVTRAVQAFRSKVYAARGTYVEHVTLAAGVEVAGGWDVTGTTWKRACVTPEDIVVVRAPAGQSITVEARDLGGEARLSLLRIESKLKAQLAPGESVYGVVAVGATTTLVLDNVRIDMNDAAPGDDGDTGAAGAAA
ncbi:MAG: virulence associated protein, partial [Labilithrix sp.]|nr:virulence associated protein [Labilithrix sp.]